MKVHLNLTLSIALQAPLHVGSGHGRGLIRRAFVRDVDGWPYIPGASLKGRTRSACEALARGVVPAVCGIPRVAESREQARHAHERCVICRTFGAIGGNSPDGRGLRWEDAHASLGDAPFRASDEVRNAVPFRWALIERTHVQLSRARGVAAEERLYSTEAVAPYVAFHTRVVGWLEATPCGADGMQYYEIALLLAGLRLVNSLGGMRRRGTGACEITPEDIGLRAEGESATRHPPIDQLLSPLDVLDRFPIDVR